MEDAAYAEVPERALPLARALAGRVAPAGTLVLNRHFRFGRPRAEEGDARAVRAGQVAASDARAKMPS